MTLNVKKHIRIFCLKHVLIPIIPLIFSILLLEWIPFSNIFLPYHIDSPADAQEAYDNGYYYVEFNLDRALYTGYDTMKGNSPATSYYYDLDKNYCTFLQFDFENTNERSASLINYTITAKLVHGDAIYDQMIEQFASDIGWTGSGLNKISSPIIISESEYHLLRYVIFFLITITILIVSLLSILSNILYIIIPKWHPAIIKLRKFGKITINDIDNELNDSLILDAGHMHITKHYFVDLGRMEISIIPLDRIIWSYSHNHWNNFLHMHFKLVYTLTNITDNNMKFTSIWKNRTDTKAIIEYLHAYNENILIGHTPENKKLYKEIRKSKKSSY